MINNSKRIFHNDHEKKGDLNASEIIGDKNCEQKYLKYSLS
jgi:hypothetical protein